MSGIIPKIENKFYQLGNAYQQFIDAAKSLFVLKSGDTMTGTLTLSDPSTDCKLNVPTNNYLELCINNVNKFVVGMAGSPSYTSVSATGVFFPIQSAGAPAYVKGGLYFDTTLNKLRVGGATAWETVTSV